MPSATITETHTVSPTLQPTQTAIVPVVISHNVFKPEQGGVLTISMKAAESGRVSVRCYDINGDLVRPLIETDVQAGLWFQAQWDGRNANGEMVASGVYFCSVKGAGIRTIKKVIVLK